MSKKQSTPRKPFFSGEPFERLVALLIAIVTIIAALSGFLEADAGARSDRAIRDAQQYAIQATNVKARGEVQIGYAWSDAYRLWLELDTLAFDAEQNDDSKALDRYRDIQKQIIGMSPLLAPPYFDPSTDDWPDVNAFEADLYRVETTALSERFINAAAVSDAWAGKASTYVKLLTLMAVTLFLFGLSTTVVGRASWLFVGVGALIVNVCLVWMIITIFQPVPELPDTAIVAYARGTGLAFQNDPNGAVEAFNEALEKAPDYANAYYERGTAHFDLGNFAQAAADYKAAVTTGRDDVNVLWNLGWTYYVMGRFEDATDTTKQALEAAPDRVALHFNLGLAYLANDEFQLAQATYDKGIALVRQQVEDARNVDEEPPSSLWWYMETAALDLANLLNCIYDQVCIETPPYDLVSSSETIATAAEGLNKQIRDLTIALEYSGQVTSASVMGYISDLEFAQGTYDDEGVLVDYASLPDQGLQARFGMVYQEESELANIDLARRGDGINEVFVLFDYQGLEDGQLVVVKTYLNGRESIGLRLVEEWNLGTQGRAVLPMTPPNNEFSLSPGDYRVEVYVDAHLIQQGGFAISGP
ncbi:MAG: tetratricopeptide repeat protein [Chloroflexi bacterium]|nr:tetratricopeptide repeat protein [Chloroflexota bacterium]